MKSVSMAVGLMAASAVFAGAHAQPTVLWETTGLKTPELALPVPAEGFAYVSNVAGNPTDKDGNGFISKVSFADGKIIALEWAKGMDAAEGARALRRQALCVRYRQAGRDRSQRPARSRQV